MNIGGFKSDKVKPFLGRKTYVGGGASPSRIKYKRPNNINSIGFNINAAKYVFEDVYKQAFSYYTSMKFPDPLNIENETIDLIKNFVAQEEFQQSGYNSLIDYAYDNIVLFKSKENIIPRAIQVYINLIVKDEIGDYLITYLKNEYGNNYIVRIRQNYEQNKTDEEIMEEYELNVIELFIRILQTRFCELQYIETQLNNLETSNFLSKEEYRMLIANLYLRYELLEKSKYIYENRFDPNVNSILIGRKKIDNYYLDYVKEKFKNDKVTNDFAEAENIIVNPNPIDDDEINPDLIPPELKATNYFDINKNKKKYALHHVAYPGTYQIDLMFSGTRNNCFLVAIEVNTRYVFAIRTNIELIYDGEKHLETKSTFAIYLAMQRLFDQGWYPSIIKSDSESAFKSDFIKQYVYAKRGIRFQPVFRTKGSYNKSQPMHTSLAIVDRFVKTLKTNFLDIGYFNGELPADLVDKFVDYYNKERPHSTLSKLLKTPTTPEQVHNDIKKEIRIIRELLYKNREIMQRPDWELPPGTLVKVYKGYNKFNKLRSVRPEKHIVLGNLRNIYAIENPRTEEKELISRVNIARN